MPKRLIVCCDGTWNTADQAISGRLSPTNVTKLALSIADKDSAGVSQRVYYHSGVGTSRRERLVRWAHRYPAGALHDNVAFGLLPGGVHAGHRGCALRHRLFRGSAAV